MLNPDHILKAQLFPNLGDDLNGSVVYRIAQVEADEGAGAILPREKFSADQGLEGGVRIIVPHEDRDLEFILDPQLAQ